jgi:aromatic ring-opening dioxygenase catalytic subunit (LigB family)
MDWTMGPKDSWDKMAAWLRQMRETIGAVPKAILVISGHWEAHEVSITSSSHPGLIYDYYGFPEHTYQLTWPAPGAPEVASRIQALLGDAGIPARLDPERGFDHGVFIPFKLVFPEAEIPTVALSLRADLDPEFHLRLGKALAPLREQGVLIVGSGMSYHNLRAFGPAGAEDSRRFDAWLTAAATNPDPMARERELVRWESAPSARRAHPREEHLLPLMVAAGAAGDDIGERVYQDNLLGMELSAYRFGPPAQAS